ncbi:hypothetical protein IWW55_005596, partial [Coemansia sp. RSA 2706]
QDNLAAATPADSQDDLLYPPDGAFVTTDSSGHESMAMPSSSRSGSAQDSDHSDTGSDESKHSLAGNNEQGSLADSASSDSSNSTNSESNSEAAIAAAPAAGDSGRALRVGLGIGIPLGLLILAGLAALFLWYKRQARRRQHEDIIDISGAGERPATARDTLDRILMRESVHADHPGTYEINMVLHNAPTGYLDKPSAEPRKLKDMPPQYHELPENRPRYPSKEY